MPQGYSEVLWFSLISQVLYWSPKSVVRFLLFYNGALCFLLDFLECDSGVLCCFFHFVKLCNGDFGFSLDLDVFIIGVLCFLLEFSSCILESYVFDRCS